MTPLDVANILEIRFALKNMKNAKWTQNLNFIMILLLLLLEICQFLCLYSTAKLETELSKIEHDAMVKGLLESQFWSAEERLPYYAVQHSSMDIDQLLIPFSDMMQQYLYTFSWPEENLRASFHVKMKCNADSK